jgi:hypothetical protein
VDLANLAFEPPASRGFAIQTDFCRPSAASLGGASARQSRGGPGSDAGFALLQGEPVPAKAVRRWLSKVSDTYGCSVLRKFLIYLVHGRDDPPFEPAVE